MRVESLVVPFSHVRGRMVPYVQECSKTVLYGFSHDTAMARHGRLTIASPGVAGVVEAAHLRGRAVYPVAVLPVHIVLLEALLQLPPGRGSSRE